MNHYSASYLIKKLDKELINDKNKTVANIDKNQDKLIIAINHYVDREKAFLLDGHFCLLNSKSDIVKIPEETFKKINPSSIMVIYDEIQNIQIKNNNRDFIHYDNQLLADFQNQELAYSKYIANKLKVPYVKFDINAEISAIVNFIKTSLEKNL